LSQGDGFALGWKKLLSGLQQQDSRLQQLLNENLLRVAELPPNTEHPFSSNHGSVKVRKGLLGRSSAPADSGPNWMACPNPFRFGAAADSI
jgi:hypothetical protein